MERGVLIFTRLVLEKNSVTHRNEQISNFIYYNITNVSLCISKMEHFVLVCQFHAGPSTYTVNSPTVRISFRLTHIP